MSNHQAQFKMITRILKQMYRVENSSTGKQAVIKPAPSAQIKQVSQPFKLSSLFVRVLCGNKCKTPAKLRSMEITLLPRLRRSNRFGKYFISITVRIET